MGETRPPIGKVHMLGIGGVGMSGIARVLLAQGVVVSGSDIAEGRLLDDLRALGAMVTVGHRAENLGDADVLAYSTAVKPDNPELVEAQARGIPVLHRSELLAQVVRGREMVAVTGTHGKTSTSSLLGHVLIEAGLDPTVLVGGVAANMDANARYGTGSFAVVEACESDRSFLNLAPTHAILTNIEAEHLDNYSGLADIIEAFTQFVRLLPSSGTLAACANCPNAITVGEAASCRVVTYADADRESHHEAVGIYAAEAALTQQGTRFTVRGPLFGDLGEFETRLVGMHYVQNATGVIGLALSLGVDVERIRSAVATFRGVARRFEFIGITPTGALVYDDYAHHPTEIRATLSAAKQALGRRIVALFQPHLFSRTMHLMDDFACCFGDADALYITEIYGSREGTSGPVRAEDLVRRIEELGGHPGVRFVPRAEAVAALSGLVGEGDVVFVIGAGDIWQIGRALTQGEVAQ